MHTCTWPGCGHQVANERYFCQTKSCRLARASAGQRGLTHDEFTAWGAWADHQKELERKKNASDAHKQATIRYRGTPVGRESWLRSIAKAEQTRRASAAERRERRRRLRVARGWDSFSVTNARWYDQQYSQVWENASDELRELIETQKKDGRRFVLYPEKLVSVSLDHVLWVDEWGKSVTLGDMVPCDIYGNVMSQ